MSDDTVVAVRRGRREDEVQVLALADELAAFPVPPWRTAREIQRADDGVIRETLRSEAPGTVAFVADGPHGLDGAVCLTTQVDYFTGEAVAHIEVLTVAPGARGRGVARALMHAAETWASTSGLRRISLNVWVQNQRARGLYEHLGYGPETMHYLKELRAD
jgi:ribosomal protein S18 acetylase RimI-like enzyme